MSHIFRLLFLLNAYLFISSVSYASEQPDESESKRPSIEYFLCWLKDKTAEDATTGFIVGTGLGGAVGMHIGGLHLVKIKEELYKTRRFTRTLETQSYTLNLCLCSILGGFIGGIIGGAVGITKDFAEAWLMKLYEDTNNLK